MFIEEVCKTAQSVQGNGLIVHCRTVFYPQESIGKVGFCGPLFVHESNSPNRLHEALAQRGLKTRFIHDGSLNKWHNEHMCKRGPRQQTKSTVRECDWRSKSLRRHKEF